MMGSFASHMENMLSWPIGDYVSGTQKCPINNNDIK